MARKSLKAQSRWEYLSRNYDRRVVEGELKRGMKVKLLEDNLRTEAKAGDIVKITSLTVFGRPYAGAECDYEVMRVGNGKFTWRISRPEVVLPDWEIK
jgi:hypothetical protein